MAANYDIIIIGAGHNGLPTAAYLARAGLQGARPGTPRTRRRRLRHRGSLARLQGLHRRLRQQPVAAGDHPRPGAEASTASRCCRAIRRRSRRFPDGRYLMMGPDAELNRREIGKFSRQGRRGPAAGTRRCWSASPTSSSRRWPQTPPDPWSSRPARPVAARQARLAVSQARQGRPPPPSKSSPAPPAPILDRWFESEQLKATLATDAIIGAFASPSMPGTAYVLFHHVMGECNGVRGVWGYVRGGMGGITQGPGRRRTPARGRDSHQRRGGPDPASRTAGSAAWSWPTARSSPRRAVASNADANVTFLKLLDPQELPADFVARDPAASTTPAPR